MNDDLPSGRRAVCPRCGADASAGDAWCDGCGLNLRQQDELPTADAYAAQQRERRWLEQREAQDEDKRRDAAPEQAPESPPTAAQPAFAENEASEDSMAPPKRWIRPMGFVAALAVLIVAGGVAYFLLKPNGESEQPASSQEPASSASNREASEASKECGAVPGNQSNNLFNISAVGVDCGEAVSFVQRWSRSAHRSCQGKDLEISNPCTDFGWTCTVQDTGVESATTECQRDDQVIRWELGA